MSQNPSAPLGPKAGDAKSQLRRVLGFWDVLLFNIGAVLGPRWIAAAAHNGTSSISLWVLAALFFFLPTTFVIVELSTRFPGRRRLVCVVQGSVRRFSRIHRGMDVLGLHVFLFSGAADGQRGDGCVHRRRRHGVSGAGPDVFSGGIVRAAVRGGFVEHRGVEHRQVAAECWRGFDLRAAADAGGDGGVSVARARVGDAFHMAKHACPRGIGAP